MRTRTKCLLTIISLMILDILPIPVIGIIALYVILRRPPWFERTVRRLYQEDP